MKIDPETFHRAFMAVAEEQRGQLASRWRGPRAEYTRFVRTVVLPQIGKHLGLKTPIGDYYTLDCIYHTGCDTEHFGPDSAYARCFAVALEHENDIRGSCVEMNKLQLFNTPLKVLITYAHSKDLVADYLAKYKKILEGADIFGDFATHRRQLVIFGHMPQDTPLWEAWEYRNDGFLKF